MENKPNLSFLAEHLSRTDTSSEGRSASEITEEQKQTLVDVIQTLIDWWFDPKSFETPEMYEKLGVKKFKKYMPTGDIVASFLAKQVLKQDGQYNFIELGKLKEGLSKMEQWTKKIETYHTLGFAILSYGFSIAVLRGDMPSAAFVSAMNMLVNIYPVLVQRYNRIRLHKIIDKMNKT